MAKSSTRGSNAQFTYDFGIAIAQSTPTITAGSKVMWRGDLKPNTTSSNDAGIGTFSSTANYYAKGNTMSLLYDDDFYGKQFGSGFGRVFQRLFYNDTHILSAPLLPATTLCTRCYAEMFYYCTALTTAPELPAVTLVSSCYHQMFYGCSSLNYIKALFTTTPSTTYTNEWVDGVAATGTFVKNSEATWTNTGINAVPTGWTVETAS